MRTVTSILCVVAILIVARHSLAKNPPGSANMTEAAFVLRHEVPIGFLGHPVGTKLKVQGQKAGLNTALSVTKVNGTALNQPEIVWTTGHLLPDGPVELVGYELPLMVGQAPAEIPPDAVSVNPHAWRMESRFVILSGLPNQ